MSIIDLKEISPNLWKALYRGNYGTYTIKIETDGEETVDFSCNCPSDYNPCKHIAMIEEAIEQRIAKRQKNDKKNDPGHEIKLDELLKDLSQNELCDFILNEAEHNQQLKNAILLEFAHKTDKKNTNIYTQILRNALSKFQFDYEDIRFNRDYDYDYDYDYDDFDYIEIDVLDQWIAKAQDYVDEDNPNEAILICKACIEEYASWYEELSSEISGHIDFYYQERPFEILIEILTMPGIDYNELFDYCKSEMVESKYKGTEMYNGFNDLFMNLSAIAGSADDFIALQDKLLHEIKDKSSYEAERILHRKIDFYKNNNQHHKEWDVIKNNLQITSFREKWIDKLIAENKLQEAKKFINDFISEKEHKNIYFRQWDKYKLQIAQKENDIQEIRDISFRFIEMNFDIKYYNIYKSTFTEEEWLDETEKLIQHFEKRSNSKWFNRSIADLLQAEKLEERLLQYIEKHLSVDNLDEYHTCFASSFPEKTLAMFRKAIDRYAANTGRNYYKYIVSLFKKMVKIEGGSEIVKEMISQYRIIYKNRKAMMEILDQFMSEK